MEPWCPACRQAIREDESEALGLGDLAREAAVQTPSPPSPLLGSRDRAQRERTFARFAQRRHLKLCPRCSAAIEKNEGCDHMTCRCGHHFNWSTAATVVPCNRVHIGGNFNTLMGAFWGRTCQGCSCSAKAKLAVWRPFGTFLGAGASLLAMGVLTSSAAVVAVGTTAVAGPLALAYEPFRGHRRNHFGRAVTGGLRLAAGFLDVEKELILGL